MEFLSRFDWWQVLLYAAIGALVGLIISALIIATSTSQSGPREAAIAAVRNREAIRRIVMFAIIGAVIALLWQLIFVPRILAPATTGSTTNGTTLNSGGVDNTNGNNSSNSNNSVNTNSNTSSSSGDWCHTKFDWLSAHVPQGGNGADLQKMVANSLKDASGIQVSTNRIRTHLFDCGEGRTVFDGAIVLGPNEGNWTTNVTFAVPTGGAIDSYATASYSAPTTTVGGDTRRAYSGTVTGTTMSIWFWSDEHPPTSGVIVDQSSQTNTKAASTDAAQVQPTEVVAGPNCMLGSVLAQAHNWSLYSDQGDTAKYGGAKVLKDRGGLPDGWSENCSTDLVGGKHVCSIYPPNGQCRDALKVSR